MTHDDDDAREIDELTRLPRTVDPPPGLEDRVVGALRAAGLVSAPSGWAPWGRLAAACLLAGLGGWFARGLTAAPAAPAAPAPSQPAAGGEYLLLLAEPEPLRTAKPVFELVSEYREWAGTLARDGRLVDAGKLADSGRRLAGPDPGAITESPRVAADPWTGFFLIRARDLEEATALARTCPHLVYGGEISVRPLEAPGEPPA